MKGLILKKEAVAWQIEPWVSNEPLVKIAANILLQYHDAKSLPVAVFMVNTGMYAALWDYLQDSGLPMRVAL